MPLHPEIVKRLIPYMERVVAGHGHGPLFRHVRTDKDGRRSTYIARKIDDWMADSLELLSHFHMLVFAPDARCLMAGDRVGNPLGNIAVE